MQKLSAAAVVAAVLLKSAHALACGGLFCSAANPAPVDQNAERILFEIDEDGAVTATVEIKYSGDPSNFSWIIPVPETPVVEVADPQALALLDAATAPQVTPPAGVCSRALGPNDAVALLALPFFLFGGVACDDQVLALQANAGEVNVEQLPSVGPYDDIVVVDSSDSEAVADWLVAHDYVVTDAMRPLLAEYAAEGAKFLALRLAPDAGVGDIAPVRFSCPGQEGAASIPLRLTALSAEPEMNVLVFVAGPERYRPMSWRSVDLDESQVRFSSLYGTYNYFALTSWLIDEAGGRGFVTERAAPMGDVVDLLEQQASFRGVDAAPARALVGDHAFLTRLYTRVSPWEMSDDPTFVAGGSQEEVAGQIIVPGAEELCDGALPPPRCGDTYCGPGSLCGATADGDGCVCASGTTARAITAPDGRATVHCQDESTDFLADLELQDDVCATATCGDAGACVVVGGFPTCACDEGFAAVPAAGGSGLRCRAVLEAYGPEQLLWPDREPPGTGEPGDGTAGCVSAATSTSGFALSIVLLWLIVTAWARTLRRFG